MYFSKKSCDIFENFCFRPISNVLWGVFTCVGWQVTLCDPIWQVTLRSCEMDKYINSYTALYCC